MAESSIGVVYIEVAPSGKDFGKKLEGDITQAADNAAKTGGTSILGKFGGAFGKIGKVGLGAIGTIAGGITALAAKGGFQRALAIENAQAKLKGLGHDSKSIAEIMNNALASVKGTAFGLGDAATVAATLSAAGIKSGQQMTNVLKTVADTAQISGRSLTDIGTIFSSVAARGKLQGDDMLQLMSSGVPVLQLLAKHLGKTSEEVSDMVSKGKIDFQTFADSMQEGLGGAALAAGDTFQGALANVKAALGRLGEGPGKIALESLRKTFNAAIPAVDALSSQLTPFVEQLNGKLTPYVDRAVKLIEQFSQGLQDGSITVQDIAGSLGQLAGAFALFAGVGGNVDKITNVFDTLGKIGDGGLGQLTGKLRQMPGQLQSSLTGLQQFKSYFNKDIRDALAVDGDPFASAVNRIRQGADKLTGPLKLLGAKIAGSDVGQSVAGMADRLGVGFGKLTSAFDSNIKVLGVRVGNGFSGVFTKITNSKLVSGLGAMAGKVQSALSPLASGLGDVFGGIGDIVGPKLQAGLGKIGSLFGSFFSPGNFMKFLGVGAIIAALVAGLGLLDQSMQGQLFAMIGRLGAQLPGMLQKLSMQITANLPQMIAQGAAILTALMNTISENAPRLLSTAALLITTLVQGLGQALPTLLPAAVQMITSLITALIAQAPMLIEGGMQLLQGLVQGIMNSLPTLIAAIPQILQALLTAFTTALPTVLNIGVDIILNIVNGLTAARRDAPHRHPDADQHVHPKPAGHRPGRRQRAGQAHRRPVPGHPAARRLHPADHRIDRQHARLEPAPDTAGRRADPHHPRRRPRQGHPAAHQPDPRHRALHLERVHKRELGRGRHEHHHRHRLRRHIRRRQARRRGGRCRQGRSELGQGQARHPFAVPRVQGPGRRDDRPRHGRGHRSEPADRQPQPRPDSRRTHARRPFVRLAVHRNHWRRHGHAARRQ